MQRPVRMLAGAEASVWTERMLSALVNGVKGGKWFSLMDKVFAPENAGGRVDEGSCEQRCCGRGWAIDRQVRGEGRASICRSCRRRCGRAAYRLAGRQASGHSERRWQDPTVGNPDGAGPHRAGGGERDRADLRNGTSPHTATGSVPDAAARTPCGASISF